MNRPDPIRVLIVGTGGMARSHASAYAQMDNVELVAGVDVNPARLAEFNTTFGIEHGFGSVEEALVWSGFDAVSNVTPDALHHRTTMPLLEAGKHVLCEKPLATNASDAREMAVAANRAGVVNMVNLTYRNVPALVKAAKLVAAGAIGAPRHFEASYLQSWLTQPKWGEWSSQEQWLWRLSTAHGSMGVLGDVGVHILDFATFIAGSDAVDVSCRLKTFDKAPDGRIGDYTLDANDSCAMHLELENGAMGVIHASRFASGHVNDLRLKIYGTEGGLDVHFKEGESRLSMSHGPDLGLGKWRRLRTGKVKSNYQRFIDAIGQGKAVDPDFTRGAQLQGLLDLAVISDAQGGAIKSTN